MNVKNEVFEVLYHVEKPGRYTGNEINMVRKDIKNIKIRFAFCFPDLYEIGMSHLGLKILYHAINQREDTFCERVFLPWFDMQKIMLEENIGLFSLETFSTLDEFDIIGFTLQYEMCYTNVLKILQLSKLPLKSADRDKQMPIIVAGGPCSFNPEPLADFIDIFFIGEGEEVIHEFLDLYKIYRFTDMSKKDFLIKASNIDGIYVPSLYHYEFNNDGTINKIVPLYKDVPNKVRKRVINNLNTVFFPKEMITPLIEVVHDRITLEIFRGCARGCRFCQAGFIYRPVRFKNNEQITNLAQKLLQTTGCNEITLSSLSTSDYPNIEKLAKQILNDVTDKRVNISLPSLRLDSTTLDLLEEIEKVRKPTLTFAPEAGSQRLRDIINKNITEDDIYNTISIAFDKGYQNVKLYFMLGLPLENYDDIEGIAQIAQNIKNIYKNASKRFKANISVSTSFFVPKPHTPFQWEPQASLSDMKEKLTFLRDRMSNIKGIEYNWHNLYLSKIEAVFARGDRRLSKVLENALELGAQFDIWNDYFSFEIWEKAFEKAKIDYRFYSDRKRDYSEVLPWDVIDSGINKSFLINENKKAHLGQTTPSCFDGCFGCGANVFGGGVCFEKI